MLDKDIVIFRNVGKYNFNDVVYYLVRYLATR
jgi:hypothetical protein